MGQMGVAACAQVLPGGRLLAAADEAGSVSMSDLRMLGTQRKALLWQVRLCRNTLLHIFSLGYSQPSKKGAS